MTTAPTILGIDLGKNWFHLIGLDERGATVLLKKLNRGQLAAYAATPPRGVVATEACPGSQYWGRVFAQAGHAVRILPAQFVKPYVKANKNDFQCGRDRGGRQPASMRCVPLKTMEQLELQALHRMRQRAVREPTAVVNQMRALLLEHGIVVPLGRSLFERRLPAVFTDAESRLSPRLLDVLHRLRERWLAIDGRNARPDGLGGSLGPVSAACDGPRDWPAHCHGHRGGGRQRAHVHARPRHGRVARDRPEPTLDRRQAHPGWDQQAREHVPATALYPRRPVVVPVPEARSVRARHVAPRRRGPQAPAGRGGRARQQDGPDLLESAHKRGGIPAVSGLRRVGGFDPTVVLRGFFRCDGPTVNRRTASLTDKPVYRDRRRYEDRCARIPSRPGADGSTSRPDTLTQTVLSDHSEGHSCNGGADHTFVRSEPRPQ